MDPIYTFTKKIKNPSIRRKEINEPSDISKINDILIKLLMLPGTTTLKFDEVSLRTNPKQWIKTILRGKNSNVISRDMGSLIHDFTDSMMTRMREDSKYALGLVIDKRIILCHSIYGEETITPEWKILPRMLDVDNILRYVSFNLEQDEVLVQFWEKEATVSFMEWLGLTRKQAFLFGGKYRICSEIDDFHIEFQLSEKEIDDLITNHPEFSQGIININRTIHYFEINEIRVSRKPYRNVGDFIQDYKAEKFGVPKYQSDYKKIKGNSLPLLTKYIDEKDRVVRIEGDELSTEVTKDSAPFVILFADGEIEFRNSFRDELVRKFLNNEEIKLFHAGMNFKSEPENVCGLEIYNSLSIDNFTSLISTHYEQIKHQDNTLDAILKFLALKMLSQNSKNNPIVFIFKELSDQILSEFKFQRKMNRTEDIYIEFKSRDFVSDNDAKTIENLATDIEKKINHSILKIYLIGVEDDGSIEPLISSRFKSDRIEKIKKGLEQRLYSSSIVLKPIISDNKMVLLLIVSKLTDT